MQQEKEILLYALMQTHTTTHKHTSKYVHKTPSIKHLESGNEMLQGIFCSSHN